MNNAVRSILVCAAIIGAQYPVADASAGTIYAPAAGRVSTAGTESRFSVWGNKVCSSAIGVGMYWNTSIPVSSSTWRVDATQSALFIGGAGDGSQVITVDSTGDLYEWTPYTTAANIGSAQMPYGEPVGSAFIQTKFYRPIDGASAQDCVYQYDVTLQNW